jgi:hypothetical protein
MDAAPGPSGVANEKPAVKRLDLSSASPFYRRKAVMKRARAFIVGNIPLAAVLWNGGISFGGVLAFILADLIVLPIDFHHSLLYLRLGFTASTRMNDALHRREVWRGPCEPDRGHLRRAGSLLVDDGVFGLIRRLAGHSIVKKEIGFSLAEVDLSS